MFQGILSISGQPGLFKLISQTKNGIIVEGIESKKRMPIYASSKVSSLVDIAIYTTGEEVPLVDVFKSIAEKENFGTCPVNKQSSNEDLKKYFGEVLKDFDKDRVYVSNIKKVIEWYEILRANNLLVFDEEKEENK